jgi:hypothetical protein
MKTKQTILIALCLLCSSFVMAQSPLFDKYAGMDDVKSIYISKAMFDMIPAIGDVGLSLTNMKGKVESLQVLSSERQDRILQMRKDFKQLISSRHQELMRMRDGKVNTIFYADVDGERVTNLLMLADTDSSFTVIQLLGNFTLKDIREISGGTDK